MGSESERESVDLVEFLAKAIVRQPEEVRVVACDDGKTLELETASEDRGRVIGRQGRVAKALRAVLAASGASPDCRLEIVD